MSNQCTNLGPKTARNYFEKGAFVINCKCSLQFRTDPGTPKYGKIVEFFISSSALFHELHHFYLEGEKALNLGKGDV